MKKMSLLLVGLGTMLTSATLLVGGVYAMFSDEVTVSNHLKAGTLKASMVRTGHSYSILDEKGYLVETKIENENVNFKDIDNVFELPTDALIVPTSKLTASFELQNNDTVAFNYSVEIVWNDENGNPITVADNEYYLAQQIDVKLTGLTGTHTLADSGLIIEGTETVEAGDKVQFTFELEFVDDDLINNYVQDKNCYFDLVVHATQAVKN